LSVNPSIDSGHSNPFCNNHHTWGREKTNR
jgi:hypothetical protein